MLRFSPRPKPPPTISAPVVVLVELLVDPIFPVPSTSRSPPMLRFSPRPKPPPTINAPLSFAVELVLSENSTCSVALSVPVISNVFAGLLLLTPTELIL